MGKGWSLYDPHICSKYGDGTSAKGNPCKPCKALYTANWRLRNPKRTKHIKQAEKLKARYKLTIEAFEQMKAEQGGKCAICKREYDRLCIDHCHSSGKVRGLLCQNCNSAIGQLREDKEIILSALHYLELHL